MRLRRPLILKVIGATMFVVGLAVSVWLMCNPSQTPEQAMGYSNGKACFEGECKYKDSFTACVNCCVNRCPQWQQECVDACLDHWDPPGGGSVMDGAVAEIAQSGTIVGNTETTDYKRFCRAVTLLKEAQRSREHPRLSRIARLIATEASNKSGLSIVLGGRADTITP